MNKLYRGDCLKTLRRLPDESVQCCVTSPPYWGLRDYGTAKWQGGDAECEHKRESQAPQEHLDSRGKIGNSCTNWDHRNEPSYRDICGKCGARRIDQQLGLEATPSEYVARMVEVFAEVRRVLRDDGTLFCNMGDSYLSNKQLAGVPWKLAFALQDDGWVLRSDIIWCLSGGTRLYARTQKGEMPATIHDLVRLDPATVQLWNGEKWTQVLGWSESPERGDPIELVLRSGERIGCTAGHIWPTQRGDARADELKVGDVLKTCRLPETSESHPPRYLTKDVFSFLGLYLAEGSMADDTIQISAHADELHWLPSISALAAHYGGSCTHTLDGNNLSIRVYGRVLRAILETYVGGSTAKDKHLKVEAWSLPDYALKEIADGYLMGDGHDDHGNDRIRLGFCRNYALESDLRTLAARLGATLMLNPVMASNQTGEHEAFKGEWRWDRSGHWNEKDRAEIVDIRGSRGRKFWDIGVADKPHLFALASGVLTHNSKPNPMPESVRDRPTKAHEYIFLLSKSARYFWDQESVREVAKYGRRVIDGGFRSGVQNGDGHRSTVGTTHGSDPTAGRNIRSVWTIPPRAFRGAHFATFPPALVERCVKAGTSERGCCPHCGKAWERVTDGLKYVPPIVDAGTHKIDASRKDVCRKLNGKSQEWKRAAASRITLGFRPACTCPAAPAVPCVVLDPFIGSGTTAAVARSLGRDCIGIDLNPKYLTMARQRIKDEGRKTEDGRGKKSSALILPSSALVRKVAV